jgi:homoserine kinase type II
MESEIIPHIKVQYGIDIISVQPVRTGVMNVNFICDTSTIGQCVFKIYTHKSADEVMFEVELLEHLATKNFCSPILCATLSGERTTPYQNKTAILYSFIEGENPTVITEELIEKIGKMMGRLHVDTSDFIPTVKKATWDPDDLTLLVNNRGHEIVDRGVPYGQEILDFVRPRISSFRFPDMPSGVTHQDIKPENIIFKAGEVVGCVDFDNSYYGAYVHDLTTTALWTCFLGDVFNEKLFQSLVRGYETERPLHEIERKVLMSALLWRLIREIFIGPFVTIGFPDVASKRSLHFIELYKNLELKNGRNFNAP